MVGGGEVGLESGVVDVGRDPELEGDEGGSEEGEAGGDEGEGLGEGGVVVFNSDGGEGGALGGDGFEER